MYISDITALQYLYMDQFSKVILALILRLFSEQIRFSIFPALNTGCDIFL